MGSLAILQIIVLAAIVITGVYVGYNAWQNWLHSPNLKHESVNIQYAFQTIMSEKTNSTPLLD